MAPAEKEDTHIGDLITDAMEESPPSSSKTRPLISGQMVKIGGRPPQSSAASRMKVEVTGQSLLMDFLSDSEDEGVGRKEVKKPSRSPPDTLGKMSGSDQGGMFSDGDDDFCIVSTPTSTKVVGLYDICLLVYTHYYSIGTRCSSKDQVFVGGW